MSDGSKEAQDFLKDLQNKVFGGFFKGISGGINGDPRHANGIIEALISAVVFVATSKTIGRFVPDKTQRSLKRMGNKAFRAVKHDGSWKDTRPLNFVKDLDMQTAKILDKLLKEEGVMVAYKPQVVSGNSRSTTVQQRGRISLEGKNVRGFYGDLNGDAFKKMGSKRGIMFFFHPSKRDIVERCLETAQAMSQKQNIETLKKRFSARGLEDLKYKERAQNIELENALRMSPDHDAYKTYANSNDIDISRLEKEKNRVNRVNIYNKKEDFLKALEQRGQIVPKKQNGKGGARMRDSQMCHSYVTCTDFVDKINSKINYNLIDVRYNRETGLVEMSYSPSDIESVKKILKDNEVESKFTVERPNANLDNMRLNQTITISGAKDSGAFDKFLQSAEETGLDIMVLPGEKDDELAIFFNDEQFNERMFDYQKDFEEYFEELDEEMLKEVNEDKSQNHDAQEKVDSKEDKDIPEDRDID